MRKKLEIQFVSINDVWRYGNIGVDQLAGYLRSRGFSIKIGYFAKKDSCDFIFEKLDLSCDVFGFSVTSSNYEQCRYLIDKIKSKSTSIITFFGGGLVSRYYREILAENASLDYAVLGDGELPTEALLTAIQSDTTNVLKNKSIATRNESEGKTIQINTFVPPEPAYDYYIKDTPYRNSRKVHCIQTKNNICTGNCSFCTERHGAISFRNLNDIVDQLKRVYDNFGVKKIFFTDDNILDPNDTASKMRLFDLCERISKLKRRFAFQCYMKASSINDTPLDRELLKTMHDVGFIEVFVGAESGNQKDLDLYNKRTTVEDNERIISMLREYSIFPILGFISFNPYSTLESITQNFLFLCRNQCTYLFNYLYSFVIINKYTALYDMIKRDNLLLSPLEQYLNVNYSFMNQECAEILEYVKNIMVPRLNKLDYHLDWVTYSFLEHRLWYDNTPDYSEILYQYKKEDLMIIQKYLSILFCEHDLKKFEACSSDFWQHFQNREADLSEMYHSLVALHRM